MNVLLQFCMIQVAGGYINVAQIVSVDNKGKVYTTNSLLDQVDSGDGSAEAFLRRVEKVCGGKSGGGK